MSAWPRSRVHECHRASCIPGAVNSNVSLARNVKIRSYAILIDGVNTTLGTDPQSGAVFDFLLPVGDSVLRENTNKHRVEDELITPWAVVDQILPLPAVPDPRDFSRAQIEPGQGPTEVRFNSNLAGRSAWNTRWLLVIPGGQWAESLEPSVIRARLLQFIYGPTGNPSTASKRSLAALAPR